MNMSLRENWDTDVYRIDENRGKVIWLERILINEGEVYYTEDYRYVSKRRFQKMMRQGRIITETLENKK